MKEMIMLNDNPKNCDECWISYTALYKTVPDVPSTMICEVKKRFCEADWEEKRPDWCPRRPVPERKKEMEYLAVGWNACLDAIEGEE